jgi:hypothetical protein
MGMFDKLKPKQDNQIAAEPSPDQSTLDALKKFSQANKSNIGPDTSLGVANTFKDAYQGTRDLRAKAIDQIIQNANIGKNVPEADMSSANEYGKMGLDLIAPDALDMIPMGKLGKLGALGIKEGKALSKGAKSAKTAEEMMQGIRRADSSDLRIGSDLIGKQVFDTAEQKAMDLAQLGKVSTPNIGNRVKAGGVMEELQASPAFKDIQQYKGTSKYDVEKQKLINEIRKARSGE